ncbi:hypothetical protein BpHYR1_031007 [Brachionus plicatilis]|uniref:Uncharacterized protein n=1 Tax=Brachionus plicatilis TaxID=10195 RepID=A0A3M7SU29_BRAPC|nr:hypothetical protein BpHYR1_031007 [Brachionus plicatilis]
MCFNHFLVDDIDESWEFFKSSIVTVLAKLAPLRKIYLREFEQPWYDDELLLVTNNRNIAYRNYKQNVVNQNHDKDKLREIYKHWKNINDNINKQKILDYFDKRGNYGFKEQQALLGILFVIYQN